MPVDYELHKDDQLPVFWVNQIQDYIAALAPSIRLTQPTLQSLRIAGDALNGSGAGVQGLWRYVTTNEDATHPGGAAGSYDVFLVASAENVVNAPDPLTDDTDRNFYLKIIAAGGTPAGNTPAGNPIVATRKIGECDWDGTNITGFRQLVGATDTTLPLQPTAPSAQSWAFRARAAVGQSSTAPIASVQTNDGSVTMWSVYTTGVYLSNLNVAGTTTLSGATSITGALHLTAAGTALTVDNDTALGGNATVGGTLGVTGASTFTGAVAVNNRLSVYNAAGDANPTLWVTSGGELRFGPGAGAAWDVKLYRSASGTLAVDGYPYAFNAGGGVTIQANVAGGSGGITFGSGSYITHFWEGTQPSMTLGRWVSVADLNTDIAGPDVLKTGPTTTDDIAFGVIQHATGGASIMLEGRSIAGGNVANPWIYFADSELAYAAIHGILTTATSHAAGDIAFYTTPDISTTALTEVMRVRHEGVLELSPVGQNQMVLSSAGIWGVISNPSINTWALGYIAAGGASGAPTNLLTWTQTPFDRVLVNANLRVLANNFGVFAATGDANPRFQAQSDGSLHWGIGGGTATDTNLYRQGSGILGTDSRLYVNPTLAAVTDTVLQANNNDATGSGCILGYGGAAFGGNIIEAYCNRGDSSTAYEFFRAQNTAGLRWYVDGTGAIHSTSTSITAISDAALKERIEPLKDALDAILALKPRHFRWRKHKFNGERAGEEGFGLIAQEVEDVLPHLVGKFRADGKGKRTYKALRTGDLVPFLVGAVQELSAKVEALERQVAV